MGKFSFPVPGRKKQAAPQVTVTEPSNKAHRILGSTPVSIDAHKNWDGLSSSGVSVNVAEAASPASYTGSSWSVQAQRGGTVAGGRGHAASQWGDESDILPPRFRSNAAGYDVDDGTTDASSILRTRQSSSTIKSWYDKSAQPLSVSQQTSSSAIAKGLPTKAHKMLDVDNSHPTVKSKKKPSKLDLNLGRSRSSKSVPHDQYEEHDAYGARQRSDSARSPSLRSPGTPNSVRKQRKLQKRPTQESMHSPDAAESYRPGSNDSNHTGRGANASNNGLHNLYDHYEQMSLRQLMDLETKHDDYATNQTHDEPIPSTQHLHPPPRILPPHREEQSTSEPSFDFLHYQPPRTAQTGTSATSKSEKASSGDYPASISSRHTRTSRASKHTDRSMQESDLHDKSVLLLSSDSEDDSFDLPMRSPTASVSTRRPSVVEDDLAPLEGFRSAGLSSQSSVAAERRSSRSSRTSKRTSFAPPANHLNPPPAAIPKLPSAESRSSVSFRNQANASSSPRDSTMSPSMRSVMSSSSVGTATTWQNRPGYGVQEARAVTVQPAQGPALPEESGQETEPDTDGSQTDTAAHTDSAATSSNQPTPPLSPSSVDFYIRSAHSSIDGPGTGGQSRFMAVSRQEEMLLAALRQKRQLMYDEPIPEDEDQSPPAPTGRRTSTQTHKSKASEATITGTTFDFDFPAPPGMHAQKAPADEGAPAPAKRRESARRESSGVEDAHYRRDSSIGGPILSPAPTRPPPRKGILKNANQEPSEQPHERILLYIDRPVGPGVALDEPEPSPDLSDFVEYDEAPSDDTRRASHNGLPVLRSRQRRDSLDKRRLSAANKHSPSARRPSPLQESAKTARIAEEQAGFDSDSDVVGDRPPAPEPVREPTPAGDVPRPDSPISPESFPAPPSARTNLNRLARLSAVGPGTLGAEPGWWGDSD